MFAHSIIFGIRNTQVDLKATRVSFVTACWLMTEKTKKSSVAWPVCEIKACELCSLASVPHLSNIYNISSSCMLW